MTLSGSAIPAASRLEGKVAIITGGASGIGASAVRIFHENGAKVVIGDIQDELGREIADQLGEKVRYVHCDVSKEEDVGHLVDTAVSTFGKLDIMYCNAGVVDRSYGTISEVTESDMNKVLGVNVFGAMWGAKHAARVMMPEKSGCILFTSSATTAIAGLATHPYAASKYAVLGLVKNLAGELGQHGIRVNCVAPYGVVTGVMGRTQDDDAQVKMAEAILSGCGNLKGCILRADDVARAALFLASDEAGYVSGVSLVVDGGFSVINPTMKNALSGMA